MKFRLCPSIGQKGEEKKTPNLRLGKEGSSVTNSQAPFSRILALYRVDITQLVLKISLL